MKIDTLINAIRKLETQALTRPLTVRKERQLTSFFTEAYDKLLYSPNKEIFGTLQTIGKHKLPRYMYHITTEDAYLSMLKDRKIKPSQCMDSPDGIFMFDLKNFTRFWRQTKHVAEQPRTTLLNNVVSCSDGNLVMLRIPTETLDARTLRVRIQALCRCGHGNMQQEQEMIINDKHRFSHALENLRYIMQGESIANVPRYNQRKLAIEYITPNEIPMSDVSLVGKTHVNPEIVNKAHWEMRDLPNVWHSLTEGMPEAKSFEYMV